MSLSPPRQPPRALTWVLIAALGSVVVGFLAAGVVSTVLAGPVPPGPAVVAGPPATEDVTASPRPTRTATLTAPAELGDRVVARVAEVQPVEGRATLPGEVSGPALRVTLEIENGSDAAVDLSRAMVNAFCGDDRAPASGYAAPGGRPFPASVASGASATGVFVFAVPEDERDLVEITLDTVAHPVVAFVGDAG